MPGMAVTVDGQTALFAPPPGAVALVGDFTDWFKRDPLPIERGEVRVKLPRDSWTEYAWLNAEGKAFADPDNPRRSLNPWWPYPRAVEVGTYARHPLWDAPAAPAPGTAERLAWEGTVFPGTRRAYVYRPANHTVTADTPVFYVQDGVAFYRTGKLGELLDKAVAAGLVPPAVLVFVEPGDRSVEYYLNDDYLHFLTREVFPRVEGEAGVTPRVRGLWGASLGGLISLHLGARHPELFSRVVAHSGAFIAHPDRRAEVDTVLAGEWLRARLEGDAPEHLRISLDSGVLEWLLAPNRRLAASLADLGVEHQYREYASGHNWVTWRSALPEALLYALPESTG